MKFIQLRLSACALIFGALGLAACSGETPNDSDEGATTSDDEAAVSTPANETAYNFFVSKGLKNFQAAGIVGNLDQESGVDPTAIEYGGGPGRGIAQWSVGGRWNADRGDNVAAYASSHGESAWSLTTQLNFIWFELTTFSGYGLSRLRASTNITIATIAFQDDFEGCGTCDQSHRISFAEAVLRAYGSKPPAPPGKPTAKPAPPTSCGAIRAGHGISRGESVSSCGGKYDLAMQTDGNLVLYEKGKGALWSTHTNGTDGFAAIMQSDGNFVLYGSKSDPLWSSRTNGHNGADLAVQTDGNLVVYGGSRALWNSGTNGR
ncbi:MAG: phage tail tip lysozyme [Polyangiaceae bacterium]